MSETKPTPISPYRVTITTPEGSTRKALCASRQQVSVYLMARSPIIQKNGGLFTVTDASGRDVTNEVLW